MIESATPTLHETVTLYKFDGDDQTKEPVETIVLVDGVKVSHTVRTQQ